MIVDKLIGLILNSIDTELGLDSEKREQVEFGLKCLFTVVTSYSLIIVSSIVLRLFPGALLVAIAVGILRSFSGGAHASTSLHCAVIAVFYTNSLAFLSRILARNLTETWLFIAAALTAVLGVVLLLLYAPMDVPEKPINSPKRRFRLRLLSIVSLLIVIVLLLFVKGEHGYAMLLGLGWQLFSLTPCGERFAKLLDRGLRRL